MVVCNTSTHTHHATPLSHPSNQACASTCRESKKAPGDCVVWRAPQQWKVFPCASFTVAVFLAVGHLFCSTYLDIWFVAPMWAGGDGRCGDVRAHIRFGQHQSVHAHPHPHQHNTCTHTPSTPTPLSQRALAWSSRTTPRIFVSLLRVHSVVPPVVCVRHTWERKEVSGCDPPHTPVTGHGASALIYPGYICVLPISWMDGGREGSHRWHAFGHTPSSVPVSCAPPPSGKGHRRRPWMSGPLHPHTHTTPHWGGQGRVRGRSGNSLTGRYNVVAR